MEQTQAGIAHQKQKKNLSSQDQSCGLASHLFCFVFVYFFFFFLFTSARFSFVSSFHLGWITIIWFASFEPVHFSFRFIRHSFSHLELIICLYCIVAHSSLSSKPFSLSSSFVHLSRFTIPSSFFFFFFFSSLYLFFFLFFVFSSQNEFSHFKTKHRFRLVGRFLLLLFTNDMYVGQLSVWSQTVCIRKKRSFKFHNQFPHVCRHFRVVVHFKHRSIASSSSFSSWSRRAPGELSFLSHFVFAFTWHLSSQSHTIPSDS